MTNLYLLLGVPPSALDPEIKAQYHHLALELHPDRGGDAAAFQELVRAFELLSNPKERRKYEAERATWLKEVRAVQCPGCGEANSLRKIKRGATALCGECRAPLPMPASFPLVERAREIALNVGEQVTDQTGELLHEGVDWGFNMIRQGLGLAERKGKAR